MSIVDCHSAAKIGDSHLAAEREERLRGTDLRHLIIETIVGLFHFNLGGNFFRIDRDPQQLQIVFPRPNAAVIAHD